MFEEPPRHGPGSCSPSQGPGFTFERAREAGEKIRHLFKGSREYPASLTVRMATLRDDCFNNFRNWLM